MRYHSYQMEDERNDDCRQQQKYFNSFDVTNYQSSAAAEQEPQCGKETCESHATQQIQNCEFYERHLANACNNHRSNARPVDDVRCWNLPPAESPIQMPGNLSRASIDATAANPFRSRAPQHKPDAVAGKRAQAGAADRLYKTEVTEMSNDASEHWDDVCFRHRRKEDRHQAIFYEKGFQ